MSGNPRHPHSQDVIFNTTIPQFDARGNRELPTLIPISTANTTSLVCYQKLAPTVHIGTIEGTPDLKSIAFRCSAPGCNSGTFSRWHELKRHFNGSHTAQGVGDEFWCEVLWCERSRGGGYPFPRKDKLEDHVRKVHTSVVGTASSN